MTGQLFIGNGMTLLDAWSEYGVSMGDGFLDALDAPCPMKEYVENTSRMQHGKRVIVENPKVDSRELTLAFHINGNKQSDYRDKRKAFFGLLYAGKVNIRVPVLDNQTFRLIYKGSVSYGMSLARTESMVSVKFEEPDPSNRNTSD